MARTFELVVNLRRCYLRRDPVFLRSLAHLARRDVEALLLQTPPAGCAERPCRAPGGLRVRPAAQQLLRKVGLLRTAAAATAPELRAVAAAATVQRDRAAPGCAGLSAAPQQCIYADSPPYIFLGRVMKFQYNDRRKDGCAFAECGCQALSLLAKDPLRH